MRQLITLYHLCRFHIFTLKTAGRSLNRAYCIKEQFVKSPQWRTAVSMDAVSQRGPRAAFHSAPLRRIRRRAPRRVLVKVPQIAQKNHERSFSAVSAPASVIIGNFSSEILPRLSLPLAFSVCSFLSFSPYEFDCVITIPIPAHCRILPAPSSVLADPLNCLHSLAASSFPANL